MPDRTLTLTLPDEAATAALARRLAPVLAPGDTLLLSGEIGAGKSTFARALIRARLGDPGVEVPSPSFTLVQVYEAPDLTIWHVDLYRVAGPDAAVELGLDAAFDSAACLVEWPDRLGDLAPAGALQMAFVARSQDHQVTLSCPAAWATRLEPILATA